MNGDFGAALSAFGAGVQGNGQEFLKSLKLKQLGEQLQTGQIDQQQYLQQLAMSDPMAARQVAGVSTPSALQELAAYQDMTPEEQKNYWQIKRAAPIVNLGGSQAILSPQGTGAVTTQLPVTLKPEDRPENAAAKTAAQEEAKVEVERKDAAVKSSENTATNLAAFDDLRDSAKVAPSGAVSNLYYAGANILGSDSEGSKAQGDFSVKRAAAENAIRQTFRVAGSGSQSDRDAEPFINMLPKPTDSEAVKVQKIDAAVEAMKTKASALAKERGLPDPFPENSVTPPSAPTQEAPTVRYNSKGQKATLVNGKWVIE